MMAMFQEMVNDGIVFANTLIIIGICIAALAIATLIMSPFYRKGKAGAIKTVCTAVTIPVLIASILLVLAYAFVVFLLIIGSGMASSYEFSNNTLNVLYIGLLIGPTNFGVPESVLFSDNTVAMVIGIMMLAYFIYLVVPAILGFVSFGVNCGSRRKYRAAKAAAAPAQAPRQYTQYPLPAAQNNPYSDKVPVANQPIYPAPQSAPIVPPYQQSAPQSAPVEPPYQQEAPVEQAPQQEAPVEQAYQQEAPVEQVYQQEAPVEQAYQQEAPAEQAYQQEAPAEQAYQQEAPAEQAYQQEAPVEQVYQQEAPVEQAYQQEAPVEQVPQVEAPAADEPAQPASDEYDYNEIFKKLDEVENASDPQAPQATQAAQPEQPAQPTQAAQAEQKVPQKAAFCIKCGSPLNGNNFCTKCGYKAYVPPIGYCVNCGAPITAGSSFCTKCGNRVN